MVILSLICFFYDKMLYFFIWYHCFKQNIILKHFTLLIIMQNVAQKVITPSKPGVFRTVFLYTGQGESTLLVIPTSLYSNEYMYVLIDCDEDYEKNEVDIMTLLLDLLGKGRKLDVFINTHPHKDHLAGLKIIYDAVGIKEIWHSNHKPAGQKHDDAYGQLKYALSKIGNQNEYHLKGTNDSNKIKTRGDVEVIKKLGLIDFIVLSPAEFVCEDIGGEDEDARNRRIHEQCGVIKLSYYGKHILITGDSDKVAWQDHITGYHADKLPSDILSASHHGSRTFFKNNKEDKDIFKRHIELIAPKHLIVSAPKVLDSQHDHPHKDALEIYREFLDESEIFHLGNEDGDPYCVIADIEPGGKLSINFDFDLINEYGRKDTDKNNSGNQGFNKGIYINTGVGTRLDEKPMGL